MFPFSCADYTFPLLPRAERFRLLKSLGFGYVDLGLFERNEGLQPSRLAIAQPVSYTHLAMGSDVSLDSSLWIGRCDLHGNQRR